MWEARDEEQLKKLNQEIEDETEPPMHPPIEEFEAITLKDLEQRSYWGDQGVEMSLDSRPKPLRTLPSYMGEYEAKSNVMAF